MEAMLIILAIGQIIMVAMILRERGKKFKGNEGVIPMPNNKHEFAEKEKDFLYLTVELWNAYLDSPLCEKNDANEICCHIREIQDIIIRRQMSSEDKDVRPIIPPDEGQKTIL